MTDAVLGAPVAERERPVHADLRPPRWFPAAAAGAGVAAAVAIPHQPGLGYTLAFAAAGTALLPAVRRSLRRGDWLLVALGVPLAVAPSVRDAGWLVALDFLGVLALGCLVLVGVRGWWSIPVAALSVPLRAVHAPVFLARGLPRGEQAASIVRGVTAGALLVLVFGALFASADAVFGSLADRLLPDPSLLTAQFLVGALVTAFVAGGLLAHAAPIGIPAASPVRRARGVEWVLPLVALDALFAVFVAVQVAVLFGGDDHVARTAGLTYAEYARSGFFQLLAVTALTLAVVAAAVRWAPPGTPRHVLLGVLCALTAVVLVSALRRMALYEDAFGLSVLRVLAHTFALWLGAVLLLVVVAGVVQRSGWLPQAVVATAAVALVGLNAANPEAMIARSQVERFERTGELDLVFLDGLGADAVPELSRLPEPARSCLLSDAALDYSDGWLGANLARSQAERVIARMDLAHAGSGCLYPAR